MRHLIKMRPHLQLYDCCVLLKCVSLFPEQRSWWWGKGLHVRVSDWVWTELLHTLCINPGLKLHLGWKRSTQMPRRACGTEMKSGPPSHSLTLSVSPPPPTHTHTLTLFIFFLCQIFFWPPLPLASYPPHTHLLVFWGTTILYSHSYCSTDSVKCIYCSICEIGGTGRQAYYCSITRAGHFHNPRHVDCCMVVV